MKSYYEILGVTTDVTASQLELRYNLLINAASEGHSPEAIRMRLLTAAYKALSNETLRRKYDDFLFTNPTASKDTSVSQQARPLVRSQAPLNESGVTGSLKPAANAHVCFSTNKPPLDALNHKKMATVRPESIVTAVNTTVVQDAPRRTNVELTHGNKYGRTTVYFLLVPSAIVLISVILFSTGTFESKNGTRNKQAVALPAPNNQPTGSAPIPQEKPAEVAPTQQQLSALESICVEFGKARDNADLEKCESQVFKAERFPALAKKDSDLIDFQWSTFDIDNRY